MPTEVDLTKHPGSSPLRATSETQLTIGDLHGNPIKLIAFLIHHGVMELSSEEYDQLVKIDHGAWDGKLTRSDLEKFERIISKATLNPVGTIRLIGDELADRGSHDYLTLLIIKKLVNENIPLEIILSNHSIEFLVDNETKKSFSPPMLQFGHADSMLRLRASVRQGIITQDEVNDIYNTFYKPSLKLISYSLNADKTKITLYSHAPIDSMTLQLLARELGVKFDDLTPLTLGQTIDQINDKFAEHIQSATAHTLFDSGMLWDAYNGISTKQDASPFVFAIWNRDYNLLERVPKHLNAYSIDYVHGHDPNGVSNDYICNLDADNMLGKAKEHYAMVGHLRVHVSNDLTSGFADKQQPEELSVVPEELSVIPDDLSVIIAESENMNISPEVKEARFDFGELADKMVIMREYGESLLAGYPNDANIVIKLVDDLTVKVNDFFENSAKSNADPHVVLKQFKTDFAQLLHSKDKEMAKHRKLWAPIVANVGIALTGIGVVAIAGQLLYSKLKTGSFEFFFQKTQRQKKIESVDKSLDTIKVIPDKRLK